MYKKSADLHYKNSLRQIFKNAQTHFDKNFASLKGNLKTKI